MSKERPILFNSDMVRAVLTSRKTQTRRVVKAPVMPKIGNQYWDVKVSAELGQMTARCTKEKVCGFFDLKCPYGSKGTRLWVRETFTEFDGAPNGVAYRADCVGEYADMVEILKPWKPAIFMRRKHSRILLEIEDVRVERVQDITSDDAIAEGIKPIWDNDYGPQQMFGELWDSINAKRGYGWDVNPWVWVVEFKRV